MWFKAEIAKMSQSPSGHLYLELVEEAQGQRLAMMRGTIWKTQHAAIRSELGAAADQVLAKGSEIVFNGKVNYHAVYGVSLVIQEIDLSAMVGEAERRKQETLKVLKGEGALERNRLCPCLRWFSASLSWDRLGLRDSETLECTCSETIGVLVLTWTCFPPLFKARMRPRP